MNCPCPEIPYSALAASAADRSQTDVPVVSLSKGIETSTLCLMSDLIPQCLGDEQPLAFVSGPSFASEIVQGIATAVTVATGPLADRNLDAVLLTNNLTDIKMRMANEQQLALDGLLSQHDEVYVKVRASLERLRAA